MTEGPIVIIGAGPAGLSCAEAYREAGGREPVVLVGDDPRAPYDRTALSKDLLRGHVEPDEIALRDEGFYGERDLDLHIGREAIAVDGDERRVMLDDGGTLNYRALVLATGSVPATLDVEGADLPAVRTLRRVDDSLGLRDAAAGARVLVVGSGFIGCEAAASLARLGAEVTVASVESAPLALRVGKDVGRRIQGWLEEEGVTVRPETELQGIEADGERLLVSLGDVRTEADVVLLAPGIRRRSELAAGLGIDLHGDAVPTDGAMSTGIDGVLAVGDVARAFNEPAGRPLAVEHWGEALNHGRVAGRALAGDRAARWREAPGFWSTIGDRTLKHVGWGDGFDEVEVADHSSGGFTARYLRDGILCGVLTHEADDDYERGRELLETGDGQ